LSLVALPACLALLGAAAGPRVLLVPPQGPRETAVPVQAALRQGALAVPDATVATAAETAALVDDAAAAGVACAAADGACWLRLAVLAGFDHVVFVDGDRVVRVTGDAAAPTVSSSPTTGTNPAAWAAALRRAFGLEAALRVRPQPPGAAIVVDDVPRPVVAGVAVVFVAPGTHAIAATAPGFLPVDRAMMAAAGDIVDVVVELPPAPVGPSAASLALRWGGVGTLAVAAVATTTLLAAGQLPYLACYDDDAPAGCAPDGDVSGFANATAVAAIVTAVAGAVAGGAALGASVLVE